MNRTSPLTRLLRSQTPKVKQFAGQKTLAIKSRKEAGKFEDKIIDFESGPKTLERPQLKKEQIHARLAERRRLPGRLPSDWPAFLVTIALFCGFLLDLYFGLIGLSRF
jgi:hypothetical protein